MRFRVELSKYPFFHSLIDSIVERVIQRISSSHCFDGGDGIDGEEPYNRHSRVVGRYNPRSGTEAFVGNTLRSYHL